MDIIHRSVFKHNFLETDLFPSQKKETKVPTHLSPYNELSLNDRSGTPFATKWR
jgi:hypothetical protein